MTSFEPRPELNQTKLSSLGLICLLFVSLKLVGVELLSLEMERDIPNHSHLAEIQKNQAAK